MDFSSKERTGDGSNAAAGSGPDADDLRGVVHDVNQMLGVILGRAELLEQVSDHETWRRDLAAIALAARDAAGVLARLGPSSLSATVGATTSGTSLAGVVDQVCQMIRPPGQSRWQPTPATEAATASASDPTDDDQEHRWQLSLDVAANLATTVPDQVLREVLSNLLLNALAAMPAGGRIEISAGRRDDSVQLVVSDSGPGLDPDLAETVFDAGTTTSKGPGRGIGLATSRRLLQRHGGQLNHVRSVTAGAAFQLVLPFAEVTTGDEGIAAGMAEDSEAGSVLVVDDDAAMCDMMTDVLSSLGQQVTTVRDAQQALDIFTAGSWQVAFIDMTLPGRSGRELAELLRRQDPALATVLISGWGTEADMAGSAGPGDPVDLFGRKPLALASIGDLLASGQRLNRGRRNENPAANVEPDCRSGRAPNRYGKD